MTTVEILKAAKQVIEGIADLEKRGEALSARKRAELAGKSEAECKDAYDLVYYRSRR